MTGAALGCCNESFRCLLWAGGLRGALLRQLTWCLNSSGHMAGRRTPDSRDESRDNRVPTALLLREGLHAYHHSRLSDAVLQPREQDLIGRMLVLLDCTGAVWALRGGGR